jgi:hypothetical protein
MAETVAKLPEFPGFGVKYDSAKNPFFQAIMVDNLRMVKGCDVGKTLLKLIEDATPKSRSDFVSGINVMCVPKEISFVQSGFKTAWVSGGGMTKTLQASADPRHSPDGCPFYIVGGSQNAAFDPSASTGGQGSVCTMYFTNVQVVTTKGERTYPFIVLAHELIHSYHCLYGIKKDGKDEELWTSGIGIYASESMTENVFRKQLGLKPRTDYF